MLLALIWKVPLITGGNQSLLLQTLKLQLNWEAFEIIFLEKYFPDTVKQAKAKEFMFLSEGDMSVAEYQGKFEELMRFAPGIIPTEASKAKKFEDGLNPEIREKVSILKLQRYSEVVDRTLIAERSIQEIKRAWKSGSTRGFQSYKLHAP